MNFKNSKYKKLLLLGASKVVAISAVMNTVTIQSAEAFDGVQPAGPAARTLVLGGVTQHAAAGATAATTAGGEKVELTVNGGVGGGNFKTDGAGGALSAVKIAHNQADISFKNNGAARSNILVNTVAGNYNLFKIDAGGVAGLNSFTATLDGGASGLSVITSGAKAVGGLPAADATDVHIFRVEDQVNSVGHFVVKNTNIDLSGGEGNKLLSFEAAQTLADGSTLLIDKDSTVTGKDHAATILVDLEDTAINLKITHDGTVNAGKGTIYDFGNGNIIQLNITGTANAISGADRGKVVRADAAKTVITIGDNAKVSGEIVLGTLGTSSLTVGKGVKSADGTKDGLDSVVTLSHVDHLFTTSSNIIQNVVLGGPGQGNIKTGGDIIIDANIGTVAANNLVSFTVGQGTTTTLNSGKEFKAATVKLEEKASFIVKVNAVDRFFAPITLDDKTKAAGTTVQFVNDTAGAINYNLLNNIGDKANGFVLEKVTIDKNFTFNMANKAIVAKTVELNGTQAAPTTLVVSAGNPIYATSQFDLTDTAGYSKLQYDVSDSTVGKIGTKDKPFGELKVNGAAVVVTVKSESYLAKTNLTGAAATVVVDSANVSLGNVISDAANHGVVEIKANSATSGIIGTDNKAGGYNSIDAVSVYDKTYSIGHSIYAANGVRAIGDKTVFEVTADDLKIAQFTTQADNQATINVKAKHEFGSEFHHAFKNLNVQDKGVASFDAKVANIYASNITIDKGGIMNLDGADRKLSAPAGVDGTFVLNGTLDLGSNSHVANHKTLTIGQKAVLKVGGDWTAGTSGNISFTNKNAVIDGTNLSIDTSAVANYAIDKKIAVTGAKNEAKIINVEKIKSKGIDWYHPNKVSLDTANDKLLLVQSGEDKEGLKNIILASVANSESVTGLATRLNQLGLKEISNKDLSDAIAIIKSLDEEKFYALVQNLVPGTAQNGSLPKVADEAMGNVVNIINNELATMTEASDARTSADSPSQMASGDSTGKNVEIFVRALGSKAKLKDNNNVNGFSSSSGGAVVGATFQAAEAVKVGASLGYSNTKFDENNGKASTGKINSYIMSVFGSYNAGSWSNNTILSYARHNHDMTRKLVDIGLPNQSKNAKADFDSNQFGLVSVTSAHIVNGSMVFSPGVYVDASTNSIAEYKEKGENSKDIALLKVETKRETSVRVGPQIRLSGTVDLSDGMKLQPNLTLRALFNLGSNKSKSSATLNGDNQSFEIVSATKPERTTFEVLGGALFSKDQFKVGLDYKFSVRGKFSSHMGMLTVAVAV